MINHLLLNILNKSFKTEGKPTSKGNYSYPCPFCNHHKRKLEVNLDDQSQNYLNFACWVCGKKGKKINTLIKSLSVNSDIIEELKKINLNINSTPQSDPQKIEEIKLPKEYKSFLNITSSDIKGKHALKYLKSRNITKEDILKYNIGYCESGIYADRIIIPSLNDKGKLNYFIARSFIPGIPNYKNPPFSRDIIPFEFYINWDLPIILCEGVFDMLAIKRNVIPLLGKTIPKELMKKIISSNVKKIYIMLDKDAFKKSIEYCEKFINEGKKVYLVELSDKDPSILGFETNLKLLHESQLLTFSNLLEKKLTI
jgi:DNA primase